LCSRARGETTAQETPGTTIDNRDDPDYPPLGAPPSDVVDVRTFRGCASRLLLISLE
jgi:hypothetical protein